MLLNENANQFGLCDIQIFINNSLMLVFFEDI